MASYRERIQLTFGTFDFQSSQVYPAEDVNTLSVVRFISQLQDTLRDAGFWHIGTEYRKEVAGIQYLDAVLWEFGIRGVDEFRGTVWIERVTGQRIFGEEEEQDDDTVVGAEEGGGDVVTGAVETEAAELEG